MTRERPKRRGLWVRRRRGGAEPIRASGGAVWRRAGDGGLEVMLVHRSRYDDWTLPKGKREPGETDEQTAVREVEEETGLRCHLGAELPGVRYEVRGRPKEVRYWAMTVEADLGREADDEVDRWEWVPEREAGARLTYGHDRTVLSALLAVVNGA